MVRFKAEEDKLYSDAKQKEFERDRWNKKSTEYLDVSKTFASALAFFQVAIILVPLTLLVQSMILFSMGSLLGSAGLIYLVIAYFQYFHGL
jgi:hypothetical protein